MKYAHLFVLLLLFVFFTCCEQNKANTPQNNIRSKSKDIASSPESTIPNIHSNYEYTDAPGKLLIIQNSVPKSGIHYTDPSGKGFIYAIFWTRIVNKTDNPCELSIDFPVDSFEFPVSSGNYMKFLVPSESMTLDKASLPDFGLAVKSFLDTGINKSYSMKRTILPKESTAFYVVALSNQGAGGALRTGLRLHGQNLFYKISRYNSTSKLFSLMDEKEINCGSINIRNLVQHK